MPIYEYYCPDNNRIYQFYAKTLAQGKTVPKCPDNPAFKMVKAVSRFAVNVRGSEAEKPDDTKASPETDNGDDARMEAAMSAMENEFSSIDENDPRAMGRMMRRMAELTGEKMDEPMEEMTRKLEEGMDPDALEDQMGNVFGDEEGGEEGMGGMGDLGPGAGAPGADAKKKEKEARARLRARRVAPVRDPKLYDYE